MTPQSHSRPPSAAADNPVTTRRDLVAAAVTIAAVAGAADAAQAQTESTVRRFDPPGMTSPPTYNHVVEVNGPHRVVYIAGQTGVDKDGKVAEGCRAVEALRVIYDLDRMFDNLRSARERLRKGIVASDAIKKILENTSTTPKTTAPGWWCG